MREDLMRGLGDDEDELVSGKDLSDTEADITEFSKARNGDDDLSDTEADITKVQEGEQSE